MFSTSITRRYRFSAAHRLPRVDPDHKCFRHHGHNYLLEITIKGVVGTKGFIIDFFELDRLLQPLLDSLDHHDLNNIIDNPTTEIMVHLIRDLAQSLIGASSMSNTITRVRLWEDQDSFATLDLE